MKRLGVLGDIHCEDQALAAALELFGRERVERVVSVGDIIDGLGDPHRTIALLSQVDAVAGNHDRWYLSGELRNLPDALPEGTLVPAESAWLADLPTMRTYDTPHGKLLLCHGLGNDDMATLLETDAGYALEANDALQRLVRDGAFRFVVSGHAHRRLVRRVGAVTFINAGTLFRNHGPCVLVLDLEALTATYFDWSGGQYVAAVPVAVP
jgi:putative phosphoesterase